MDSTERTGLPKGSYGIFKASKQTKLLSTHTKAHLAPSRLKPVVYHVCFKLDMDLEMSFHIHLHISTGQDRLH